MKTIPHGIQAIRRLYGAIKVSGGRVIAPSEWVERNIVLYITPQLRAVGPTKIWCNRQCFSDIKAIFEEIVELEDKLDKALVYSIDGCWVVRNMRAGLKLSAHTYGVALDLNASRNPQGAESNQSQALVRCFTKRGWEWGGEWRKRDCMHFQRCTGY